MFYDAELRLLRDTFGKCHIQTLIIDSYAPLDKRLSIGLRIYFSGNMAPDISFAQLFPEAKDSTFYKITDALFCRHIFFRLPDISQETFLVIGPFLTMPPSPGDIMEWAEANNISPAKQQQIVQFYSNTPLLPENSHLFTMLDAFGERLWGTKHFTMEDIDWQRINSSVLADEIKISDEENTLFKMAVMEQRYAFENELMEAVSRGQSHKAELLLSHFSEISFEQRLADPIRNLKNYSIITNTLLRKAAEKGGVHPIYLDSLSSSFALRIEQLKTIEAAGELMIEIFRAYCRLVRKHSMKNYSPPVQKAITCIDADLSANLSLRSLAQMLNVSSSYLSTLFKKETGQTITDYINQRRVKYAMHLLETTKLQVQTIAQHCGIVDVHYFTKVFKRIAGMTPKEYRASLHG